MILFKLLFSKLILPVASRFSCPFFLLTATYLSVAKLCKLVISKITIIMYLGAKIETFYKNIIEHSKMLKKTPTST